MNKPSKTRRGDHGEASSLPNTLSKYNDHKVVYCSQDRDLPFLMRRKAFQIDKNEEKHVEFKKSTGRKRNSMPMDIMT